MVTSIKSPVVLSLCPGILGLERGIVRAIGKIDIAAYVEIEAFIIENLLAAMESGFLDPSPIWTNVKTFDPQPFRGKIHGITGGYPCQPFSTAGKQGGENDPRHLWPFIKDIIAVVEPKWCFFENVKNHINVGYRTVRSELEGLGYAVKEGIFSAEEVGAPHKRERLFILALANAPRQGLEKCSRAESKQFNKTNFELADANSNRTRTGPGQINDTCSEIERTTQGTYRQWLWSFFGQRSEVVADAGSKRSTIGISGQNEGNERDPKIIDNCSYGNWPAGQGYYQYEWEEPRTIEPRLGCSIDGYNFRQDLLRAYGNAVVEQTAELAFKTLSMTHFEEFIKCQTL